MIAEDPLLTSGDASRILKISTGGLRQLARAGKLVPDEQTPTGQRLFRQSTIEKLRKEREQNPPRPGRPRKDKENESGQ